MLTVTHLMPFKESPSGAVFSGAENHLFTLMEAQRQSGLAVELGMLIYRHGPVLAAKIEALRQQGVVVFSVEAQPLLNLPDGCPRLRSLRLITDLRRILSCKRGHIIHTHLDDGDLCGKIAAWLAGCPYVVSTFHNNEPHYLTRQWQMRLKLLERLTKEQIAISNAVRQELVDLVGLSDKLTTVYYGVKVPSSSRGLEELRHHYQIPLHRFVVGFVGRLMPQKNIAFFIEALAQLPNVHGVIVGEGPLRSELEAQSRCLQMRNIQFLGYQPNGAEIISCFDVFCLPSRWEGLGLVLLEAMLQKVLVIGSRAGAIPEILGEGQYGLLCDSDEPSQLAAQIRYAQRERENTRRIIEKSFDYAQKKFTVEAMVKETVKIYKSVLENY